MATVLGVKLMGHDTGAALIHNGRMVAISEERLNRIKHSPGVFPEQSIAYCLKEFHLTPEDITLVVTDRAAEGKLGKDKGQRYFTDMTGSTFKNARVVGASHHDAHAATAYYCSPFTEAAILVYDGNGDHLETSLGAIGVETETVYRGVGDRIVQLTKTLHRKQSRQFLHTTGLGRLYSMISNDYLGFGTNNEGKMMGLAAYGDNRVLKKFPPERWMREVNGQLICTSRIIINRRPETVREWIRHMRHSLRLWRIRRADTWSLPEFFEPIVFDLPPRRPQDPLPSPYYAAVAHAAQKIFEMFGLRIGKQLRAMTGSDNLCVAGGCALNIDANRNFLSKEVGFKRLFIQPAASDAGIPLGCALWGWHMILNEKRIPPMRHASLGRTYTDEEIRNALEAHQAQVDYYRSPHVVVEAADRIAAGDIIGWFQGGCEYGPRALGNRSIVCDARPKNMRDTLNARVKHREMWRPFAASVLLGHMREWFELDVESPFMLLMADVVAHKQNEIPSVVHADGTCRLQSLTKEDNGIYFDLVNEFYKKTGTPLILNTSFNLGGEPIVESPQDALKTFLATDMDALILHDWVVTKKQS